MRGFFVAKYFVSLYLEFPSSCTPIDLVEGNQEETWRGIIFGQYWAYDHTFHFQISSWLSTQGKPEDLLNDFSELYPNYLPIQNHGYPTNLLEGQVYN